MSHNEPTAEFIQLLTSSQSRLYAYTLSLLGDRQQAMDVMQETNLILWRKADQFQLGTNFGAWMMKIAFYQVMAHRRKFRKQEVFIDDAFIQELADDTQEFTQDIEQQQIMLNNCIEKLPNRQRDIVHKRYSEGSSIKQIAERLGTAVSAIKQVLFRARTNLIQCVQYQMKENSQ